MKKNNLRGISRLPAFNEKAQLLEPHTRAELISELYRTSLIARRAILTLYRSNKDEAMALRRLWFNEPVELLARDDARAFNNPHSDNK